MANHRHAGDCSAPVWLISDLEDAMRSIEHMVASSSLAACPQSHILLLPRILATREGQAWGIYFSLSPGTVVGVQLSECQYYP